jgi:predicted protein tyrosine phosphatase
MQEIIVHNRSGAEKFFSVLPWAAIQITNLDGQWPSLSSVERTALLQMRFPDRAAPDAQCPKEALFTETQADQILEFVLAHKDQIDRLLIHCEMGTGRSPAIAAALTRIFLPEVDYYDYFQRKNPNLLVYGRVLAAAQKRGLYHAPE